MVIESLIPETSYTEITYDMCCPTAQKDVPKRICKDCETYFPSGAAVKIYRKDKCCHGFVEIVDGNVSDNEDELSIEFQGNEIENSATNTAPILNIFEMLTQMSFIDDDKIFLHFLEYKQPIFKKSYFFKELFYFLRAKRPKI